MTTRMTTARTSAPVATPMVRRFTTAIVDVVADCSYASKRVAQLQLAPLRRTR